MEENDINEVIKQIAKTLSETLENANIEIIVNEVILTVTLIKMLTKIFIKYPCMKGFLKEEFFKEGI